MTVQRQDAGYPAWDALTDRAGSLALTTVTRGACHAQLRTVARDTAAPLPRSISTVNATDRHGLIRPLTAPVVRCPAGWTHETHHDRAPLR